MKLLNSIADSLHTDHETLNATTPNDSLLSGPKQEEATEKFKAVSEAYACLGDVTRRRQYDLHGSGDNENKLASMEAVEVENVGWLGRFLAAQVAKLGEKAQHKTTCESVRKTDKLAIEWPTGD